MRYFSLLFLHLLFMAVFAQNKSGILLKVPSGVNTHVITITESGNLISLSGSESGTVYLNVFDAEGVSLLYSRTLNPGFSFVPTALVAKEGYFYVGGKGVVKPENNIDGILLKLDEKGEILGKAVFGGEKYDAIEKIIIADDGALVFGGTSENETKGSDAWAGMTDLSLNALWQSRFGWEKEENAFDIIQRKDGTFLMGGTTASKGAGLKDMILYNIDKEGLMLWARVYGKPDASEIIYKICEMEDSTLILAGTVQRENLNGMIYKTNTQGTVEWSLDTGSSKAEKLSGIAAGDAKSGIRVYGNSGTGKNENPSGWMLLIDKNGSLVQQTLEEEGILYSDCLNVNPVKIAGIDLRKGFPFVANGLSAGKLSAGLTDVVEMKENSGAALLATKSNSEIHQNKKIPESETVAESTNTVATESETKPDKPERYDLDPFTEEDIARPNIPQPEKEVLTEESVNIPKTGYLYSFCYGLSQTTDKENINGEAENDAQKLSDFFTLLKFSTFHNIYPGILKGEEAKVQNLKSALLTVKSGIKDSDVFMMYLNTELVAPDSFSVGLNTQDVIMSDNLRQAFTLNALVKSLIVMKGEKVVLLDLYCPQTELWELYRQKITEAFEDTEQVTVVVAFQSKQAKELQLTEPERLVPEVIMRGMSSLADTNKDKEVTLYEFCDYIYNGINASARNVILSVNPVRTLTDFPLIFLR